MSHVHSGWPLRRLPVRPRSSIVLVVLDLVVGFLCVAHCPQIFLLLSLHIRFLTLSILPSFFATLIHALKNFMSFPVVVSVSSSCLSVIFLCLLPL